MSVFKCALVLWLSVPLHAQLGWPAYGGDAGGQRYSAASQITPANVTQLKPAWEYHTGALASKRTGYLSASFEATPVLFRKTLYVTTPFDEIFALDAVTGERQWSYDPNVQGKEGDLTTSRGVAVWEGPPEVTGPCRDRVFVGTLDARLVAVDAADGKPCPGFGINGQVVIHDELGRVSRAIHITSPPTVVGNVVVIGSSIPDNQAASMDRGTVRAYDVLTGKQIWKWDPLPTGNSLTGAANAWSDISTDPALGLIYIPTSSPSPDYYGGLRPGADADSDSVVAVDAATGKKVWAFQLVHHDLWDYDTAAQPLLFTFRGTIPAIAVTNKTGMVYVLDRRTGVPLYPVDERSVPASDVPGEHASPTQPFSRLPSLNPLSLIAKDGCERLSARLRYDGIFTPPSVRGTVESPGPLGGVNWGSAAFDPKTGIYYALNNRAPFEVRLVRKHWGPTFTWKGLEMRVPLLPFVRPNVLITAVALTVIGLLGFLVWRPLIYCGILGLVLLCLAAMQVGLYRFASARAQYKRLHVILGVDDSPMWQTPYSLDLRPFTDPSCLKQAPSAITALNLQTGQKVWESPLNTIELGGPIVTAGGLVFAAGTRDTYLRAFDKLTGHELWRGTLPASAQATPMTYAIDGKQFVVIAAGGHGLFNTSPGDSLIAYALSK